MFPLTSPLGGDAAAGVAVASPLPSQGGGETFFQSCSSDQWWRLVTRSMSVNHKVHRPEGRNSHSGYFHCSESTAFVERGRKAETTAEACACVSACASVSVGMSLHKLSCSDLWLTRQQIWPSISSPLLSSPLLSSPLLSSPLSSLLYLLSSPLLSSPLLSSPLLSSPLLSSPLSSLLSSPLLSSPLLSSPLLSSPLLSSPLLSSPLLSPPDSHWRMGSCLIDYIWQQTVTSAQ